MKYLCATLVLLLASLGACSNMTGLWNLDWQSRTTSVCTPDFFTINQDAQGNYTAVFNYTQNTISTECPKNFTGNYTSNLTYNATSNAWMDNTNIQLAYDNTTDTLRYLFPNPTYQMLYDRNGSYIPQNASLPFIGAFWTNITVLANQSYDCVPSSILITPGVNGNQGTLLIVPTFPSSAPNCTHLSNYTFGFIYTPTLQNLTWTGIGADQNSENNYIFDPYNSPNQLTVNITNASTGESICVFSAQRFTDFVPLNGTWLLDWQSSGFETLVPSSIQATPEDNNAYIATWVSSSLQANGSGYLVGGPNNQYFESTSGMGFIYNQNTNSLLGFSTPRFPHSVLYSPNGSLINNNFVLSNWTSPLLANGSNVPSTCCTPNKINLNPAPEDISAAFYFDSNYTSNPSCQDISQFITTNPEYTVLIVSTPSTQELLWSDQLYGTTIFFANASNTSEITVQNFFGQSNCTFNMQIALNPPAPLSATWMSSGVVYLVIGIFMMLNWI